jgi:hypothetical protein
MNPRVDPGWRPVDQRNDEKLHYISPFENENKIYKNIYIHEALDRLAQASCCRPLTSTHISKSVYHVRRHGTCSTRRNLLAFPLVILVFFYLSRLLSPAFPVRVYYLRQFLYRFLGCENRGTRPRCVPPYCASTLTHATGAGLCRCFLTLLC